MEFNFNYIIERHKRLVSDIKSFWYDLEVEPQEPMWHLKQFAFPWAILAFLITFLHLYFFYYHSNPIALAIAPPLGTLAVIFGGSFVLEKLADNYNPTSKEEFLIILNYASIPIFLGHFFNNLLSIISVFSLVILWTGFEAKVKVEANKKVGFFILSVIILFLIQTIAQAVLFKILGVDYLKYSY